MQRVTNFSHLKRWRYWRQGLAGGGGLYASLFLSNVIKPTFSFTFHQIKDNTYFWEKFLMKTAASFSLHLNCISHPFSDAARLRDIQLTNEYFLLLLLAFSSFPRHQPLYPITLLPLPSTSHFYPSRHRLPGTLYYILLLLFFFFRVKRIHRYTLFSRLSSFHSISPPPLPLRHSNLFLVFGSKLKTSFCHSIFFFSSVSSFFVLLIYFCTLR